MLQVVLLVHRRRLHSIRFVLRQDRFDSRLGLRDPSRGLRPELLRVRDDLAHHIVRVELVERLQEIFGKFILDKCGKKDCAMDASSPVAVLIVPLASNSSRMLPSPPRQYR